MPSLVQMTAQLMCSFGSAPSTLVVVPKGPPSMTEGGLSATIMDHVPLVNIMPFGMCNTVSNPTVASATAAASGVLTPMPCVPVTASPWAPGNPQALINNVPSLTKNCQCQCAYGGVITIINPAVTTSMVS